jgi:hypothetical protein
MWAAGGSAVTAMIQFFREHPNWISIVPLIIFGVLAVLVKLAGNIKAKLSSTNALPPTSISATEKEEGGISRYGEAERKFWLKAYLSAFNATHDYSSFSDRERIAYAAAQADSLVELAMKRGMF